MLSVVLRVLSTTLRRIRIRRSIRVTLLGPRADIALVTIRQGLLGRLMFLEAETDDVVCSVPAPCGGRQWLYDSPSRLVTDRGVIAALERVADQHDRERLRRIADLAIRCARGH